MSETSSITPDLAVRVLEANWKNVVKKVSAGRTLNTSELAVLRAKAAGSQETVTQAKDVVELARVLGVTRQTLYSWRKKKDEPKPSSNGTHDIVAWRSFINSNELKSELAPYAETLKARKLLAEIEDRELKVAIRKGEYILLNDVREGWLMNVSKVRSLLEARLLNEMPPILTGKDAIEIRNELEKVLMEIYATLHSGGKTTP